MSSIHALPALKLPESLGTLEEFHWGHSGKTLFYLQDAHDSLEAQENIAKIIQFLIEHQGVKTVFEEGYEGAVPSDAYFGGIQDSSVREKVSYYLLDKLRIGGAEYAHINRKKNFELIGADSIALHFENIRAFQQSALRKEETKRDLEALNFEIRKLTDRTFPNELKEALKLKKRFDDGGLPLLDYVNRLFALNGLESKGGRYPALQRLLSLQRENARLNEGETLDAKAVYSELQQFEAGTAGKFLKDEDSLRLFAYLQSVELLQRLNEMKVSFAEYEALRGTLRDLDTRQLAKFLVQKSGQSLVLSRQWEKNIREAVRFYVLAKARDKKIEKVLNASRFGSAILVFGGFHKESIKNMLRRSGDSYYVISPHMTAPSPRHQAYYQQLMKQGYRSLSLPAAAAKASVAPRAMEFPVLNPSQAGILRELIAGVESAARKVKPGDPAEILAEMDLILSSRSELRSDDWGKIDPQTEAEDIYGQFSELFSELVNSLDGNRLSTEIVRQKGYGQLLQRIQERMDFVRQAARDHDYGTVSRTLSSIESAFPQDGLFDPAREALHDLQDYLKSLRSELRTEYVKKEEKVEPPLSAVEIHAFRLARERKVVGLPYFANYHQVSFGEAARALEKAGFESYGPSEVGEQFVYPLTAALEQRLLKENPETGEDETRVSEILKIGDEFLEVKNSIARQEDDEEWVRATKLSTIPSEQEPLDSPDRKAFYFRENMEHGLNNLLTILLLSPRSVRYTMLTDVVDDLWVSIKVLDDLTGRPLNDYQAVGESVKPFIYGHNAANRIGSGAVSSAAAHQFTARHYEEIREIRKRLEQVYGRVLRIMNSREREFVQRSELRGAEEWEDPAGVVTVEKDQGFFAGLAQKDKEVLMKALSGSRDDIRRMARESGGKIYFKNEDGDFSEEGRSVYLKLEVPVEVFPKNGSQEKVQITHLRIKGLKPILTPSGEVQLYTGQGSVRRSLIPDQEGVLNSVEADPTLAGGMRDRDARTEFSVMTQARDFLSFRTDYAVAWGTFPGISFQEGAAGFVIAGLTGDDWRVTSVGSRERSGVTFAVAPVQARSGGEMDRDSEAVLYQALGQALRSYHDGGFYHGFPHPANIGVELVKGRFEIIFRDLNTTVIRTPGMTAVQEQGYRFVDVADVLYRVINQNRKDLIEPFLKSYFGELSPASGDFQALLQAVNKDLFFIKIARLDDTLPSALTLGDGTVVKPKEVYPPIEDLEMNDADPEFGALWKNLGQVLPNRSELRQDPNPLILFLHNEVFIHRYGHYEILADHPYADLEDVDRETLRLLQDKAPMKKPGPFRVVLLNAYTADSAVGNKNSHLVILNNDLEHPVAMGFVTLQDAETFLEGLGDGPFKKGESKERSYFVSRTDVFGDYKGEALMQRAVTALLLKGDIRKWIPSATQLYPSRKMYERMQEDKRLVLEGRPRVKVVSARSELRTTEPSSPHVVEVYDLQKNDLRILFNETASGHFRFDLVNRKSYWDGEPFDHAMGGEENDPLGRRVNKPWAQLEAELEPLGYREADIYSYHNLYYVDWFVLYDGASRKAYHREGEPLSQRSYSMFVNWKDKSLAPSSEDLSFEETADGSVRVFRTSDLGKTDLSSEIRQAFFGQRVLHEGQVTPFENIAHQFEDIFQVYLFPQFIEAHRDDQGQVDSYVYKESLVQHELVRLRDENRDAFKEVIRQDGRMTIDLSPYFRAHSQEDLEREALENPFRKYVKVTPRPLEELAAGEYFIEDGRLSIHLKRFPYPHDLVGITKQGKAVAFVIIGDKFEGKGTAAQDLGAEVQRLYSEKMKALGKSAEEDPLQEVFLLANSRDAMQRKWKDGVSSVAAASARPYPSSTGALVFAKIETAAVSEARNRIGTQEELVRQISENWDAIRERGFFMFDMQKTLAARKKAAAAGMIELLAWMLEEKIRLVINSGNPMKDVMDQVLEPLKNYLSAQGKLELLSGISFSVYSASGTVFVTFDEKGNPVEHSDYETKLRISRPVLEQTIHDVLVEFGQKQFGLDAAGIEALRASYVKDAAKNPGLVYELPWADKSEAYQPSRVHFDDLGNKSMTVQGPYIQLRGSQVTDTEATSITITKLPPEIRPAIIDRLKELLSLRLGEDFVNHLSLSVGGESSIDIFSADANKAKALIHYAEDAVKNSGRPLLDLGFGYYFGDELTGNVHGSTMSEKVHKGNDMIVADYSFPDAQYRRIKLVSLSPEAPEGIAEQDLGRTYWGGVEQEGTEDLFAQVRERVETIRASGDPKSSEARSELRDLKSFERQREKEQEILREVLGKDFTLPAVLGEYPERFPWPENFFRNWATVVKAARLSFEDLRSISIGRWSDEQYRFRVWVDGELVWRDVDAAEGFFLSWNRTAIVNAQAYNAGNIALHEIGEAIVRRYDPSSFYAQAPKRVNRKEYLVDYVIWSLLKESRQHRAAADYKNSMFDVHVNVSESQKALAAREASKILRLIKKREDARSELRAENELVTLWKQSSPEEKRKMLEVNEVLNNASRPDFTDWLMYVLLEPDFTLRRDVVERNNWSPGLMISPEILFEHLSRPWESLAKYGPPAMPPGQAFNETHAIRNKRMALLILLTERAVQPKKAPQAVRGAREYIQEVYDLLKKQIQDESALWLQDFDANFSVLKDELGKDADFVLGQKRPMSFFEAFVAESMRYMIKEPEDRNRDTLGWFHDDYEAFFVHTLEVPVFREVLDRIAERFAAEKREAEGSLVVRSGLFEGDSQRGSPAPHAGSTRSELRLSSGERIRERLERTTQLPARLFISYEEIRSPESPLYDDLFALGFQTRADKNTKVIIYGVDPDALMTPRMQQLRNNAGIITIEGDLQRAYQLYGKSVERTRGKDETRRVVHFAMHAERLKEQLSDKVMPFLASENHDLFAALLLARSGGQMPGVYQNPQNGFYSVVEGFLKTELARYQASLIIERAA